jgi:CRISPR-associated endonuclease Cas2
MAGLNPPYGNDNQLQNPSTTNIPTMSIARYWISYDIVADAPRRQLHDLLSSYGVRVQFSAFECVLTRNELLRLLRSAKRWVDTDVDSLLVCQCAAAGKPSHKYLAQPQDFASDFWLA